jgi:excisionase family DNA binding protein
MLQYAKPFRSYIMPDQQLTVEEVAEELRVHAETVRQWIRDGELDAFDTGRGYRISRSDLDDFIQRRKTGRRNKKKNSKEEP